MNLLRLFTSRYPFCVHRGITTQRSPRFSWGEQAQTAQHLATFTATLLAMTLLSGCGGGDSAPSNNAPVWTGQSSFTLDEDAQLSGSLQASDVDNDTLSFSVVTAPTNATFTLQNNGAFRFIPTANSHGKFSVTVAVSDGKAAAVNRILEFNVTSINDAPTISFSPTELTLASGETGTVNLTLNDVDGDTVTINGVQTPTTLSASVTGTVLNISAKTLDAPSTANVVLSISDGKSSLVTSYPVQLFPASSSGNSRVLYGPATGNTVHLVIVGDGFTAQERSAFFKHAQGFVDNFFKQPEIAAHKNAWTIHALHADSRQSGIDDPASNITVDTAFDGTFNCSNIDRLLCVSNSKVFSYVRQFVPQYNEVLVIGNSTKYGGSGGSLATMSVHPSSNTVAIHELGHSFADLADEYVDDANAAFYAPFYSETKSANVTKINDASTIKWRHWFADPSNIPTADRASGVGIFEGAYYHSKGYYRPLYDSFMRSLGAPIGVVNGEAWASKIYAKIGFTRAISPAAGNLTLTRGSSATFSVQPTLGAPIQKLEWYVNNQLQAQWTNQTSIICCSELNSNYTVSAVVTDITGVIRLNTLASNTTRWSVTLN